MTLTAPEGQANTKEFIGLMAAMMSIVAISIDAMLPAIGLIGKELGASHPNQAQYIISCIFAGMAISQLVCGPLSDAIGRKRLLYASLGLYLLGTVLCLISNTMNTLLIGRFIQGLGVAGPYVTTVAIVRDRFSGNAMAKVMSLVMMIFIMVPAIAPSLGQGIMYFASWHAIFILYLFYACSILLWAFFRLEETLPLDKRTPFNVTNILRGARVVLTHRATTSYMLCAGCIFGALIGYLNSCLQIFQGLFYVGDAFALYFGGLALILGVASLFNSHLVSRFGMPQICIFALIVMLGSSTTFLAIQIFIAPTLWMFLTFAAIQFFCFGLMFGNMNAMAMEPMGHIAGTASAIIGSTSSVISMAAGTLIGQLYNESLVPLLVGFITLGTLSLLLVLNANNFSFKKAV